VALPGRPHGKWRSTDYIEARCDIAFEALFGQPSCHVLQRQTSPAENASLSARAATSCASRNRLLHSVSVSHNNQS